MREKVTVTNSWLKEFRKKRGLSQENLAGMTGWTNDKIGRIERGKQELSIDDIKLIGRALSLSEEEVGSILLQIAGVTRFDIMKFLPEAREDKRFEIETHVAGVCIEQTKLGLRILIAKRLSTRKLYPDKWECGGGQVKPGEDFEEAIKRQMREEFGIDVKPLALIETYQIPTPELPQRIIPGLRFLCSRVNNEKSKDIKISKREFSEYRWISEDEISSIDFISGLKNAISKGIKQFKNNISKQ